MTPATTRRSTLLVSARSRSKKLAEARAQLEEEQVLVARRQLEALRAAAESGTDAAAAEDARARLAVFEQRLTKEAAKSTELFGCE